MDLATHENYLTTNIFQITVYPLNACTSSLLTVAEACATSVDNLRKPIVYGLAVSYSSKKVEVFKVTQEREVVASALYFLNAA